MFNVAKLIAGLQGGGTILGALGVNQEAQANATAARHQAKARDRNAKLYEDKARDAILRGNAAQQRQRLKNADVRAHQKVQQAVNGVDVAYGSILESAVNTAMIGELDVLTLRSNSYREAYANRLSAHNERDTARHLRRGGRDAARGGQLASFGTLLTGGASAYQNYARNTGLFDKPAKEDS